MKSLTYVEPEWFIYNFRVCAYVCVKVVIFSALGIFGTTVKCWIDIMVWKVCLNEFRLSEAVMVFCIFFFVEKGEGR